MQLIHWRFEELPGGFVGWTLASGVKDRGIDQVGKDGIKVKPELMAVPDPAADGIQLQAIVNGLEEEIAAVKKLFPVIIQKPVGMERDHELTKKVQALNGLQGGFDLLNCQTPV